jgi:ABC-type bacteriocin/lantibiotic exporter with double-glycine peptidase domain
MKKNLVKIYRLIPHSKRKKLAIFFTYSLVNTILDLISIAYLVPIILILLDKDKLEKLAQSYLNVNLTDNLILILLGSLIFFYILKNSIQTRIMALQSRFIYSISAAISKKLMSNFIFESFKIHTASDKNIFFRDVFQLPMTFATNILFSIYYILSEAFVLIIIAVVSFVYNPYVSIISFALLSFLAFLLLDFQKRKIAGFNETIVHLYNENVKNITNIIQGFIEIKTTKSEGKFQRKFEDSNQRNHEQLSLLLAFKQSNVKYFEILFILGLSIGIFFFIFSKDHSKDLIFLSFLAGASIKIIPSFSKILNAFIDLKTNRNAIEILSKYDDVKLRTSTTVEFNNKIQLDKIDFDYAEKEILKNINLEIKKGDFISISGNSGEGKTTLLCVIAGLLTPKNGSVLVDGLAMNLNDFPFQFAGYASQQPFLFQGSLLENITMIDENVDFAHLDEIIKALDLTEWVEALPNGINTPLLIESKELSGGQKQRIALARVLYFRPTILLMDETTNQLNGILEEKILAYLKQLTLRKELTIIAVSHGSKVGEFADKKYTIVHGNLVENV